MERLGELYAHLEGVHRCLVQEALQDLDEMLAEIMVLAEEQLQLAATQILVLEGLEERVRVDGMVLKLVDQPIQETRMSVIHYKVSHRGVRTYKAEPSRYVTYVC